MNSFFTASILAIVATSAATAGNILYNVGAGPNGDMGLTLNYLKNTVINGSAANGSLTNGTEKNYTNTLFLQSTGITSDTSVVLPNQASDSIASLTDSTYTNSSGAPVTFAMIDDGCVNGNCTNGGNNDFQIAKGSSITIPVGIFGADEAWTMINNNWGFSGMSDTQVTFNFGNSATGATTQSAVVELKNGAGATGVLTGIECNEAVNNQSGANSAYASLNCGNYAGAAAGTGQTASTLWNGTYTGNNSPGPTPFTGTAGAVNLDDQQFNFSALSAFSGINYAGLYLISVTVADNSTGQGSLNNANSGAGSYTTNNTDPSRTVLSALTVDAPAAATPEPSTILMFLTGLGAIGFARVRRSRG